MSGDSVANLSNGNANTQQPNPRKTYQVVVAATKDMGIGKDGKLPWKLPSDLKFFKDLTLTTTDSGKKNAVIMGRKTWESIPLEHRPLPGRLNVVLTRSGSFDIATAENVVICGSMGSALELLAASPYCLSIEKVFVIGGGQILRESLNAPGCDAIHITEIETDFDCDTFIPAIDTSVFQPWYSSFPKVEKDIRHCFTTYVRVRSSTIESLSQNNGVNPDGNSENSKFEVKEFSFLPKMVFERHEEHLYLRMVQDIISDGNLKGDRTGTGTLSKFGCQKVFWRGVVEELLWFISGSTSAKVLQEKGIHIWDGNASRDYLDRHVKNNPNDRRIIISSWNPSDLKLMALPPCHMFAQFYVANGELSCQMYQRSADMGLGVPFNIASYALLTCILAHGMKTFFVVSNTMLLTWLRSTVLEKVVIAIVVSISLASWLHDCRTSHYFYLCTDLIPGDFVHVIGDAHVYQTHIRPLQEQLRKLPKPFPILKINSEKKDIDTFVAADFKLIGYDPHQKIEMKMAV
uniref:Bifunctional dihydrofolate reductase-thymidylate synthase n=1 Tax=Salix viminalis TaxID=40686 RepID=A0A6N2MR31_SALVM